MPSLDDLLGRIPVADVADRLGVDESTASAAIEEALPALVSALETNAEDPAGAASLEKAISDHSPALVDGSVNLDEVDAADGEKIVGHIFGEHKDQVVATLSAGTGSSHAPGSSVFGQLLPLLAPIVLSYVAKEFSDRKQTTQTVQPTEPMQPRQLKPTEEPTGLGGVLGGLFGSNKTTPESGIGIHEVLGGLLGGVGKTSGGIGDVLGSFLGSSRT